MRQTEWRKQDSLRENEALAIGVEQKERMVDLKCRALKSIANLSALVAGFTIVMFIELSVEETVPDWLVVHSGYDFTGSCYYGYGYGSSNFIINLHYVNKYAT